MLSTGTSTSMRFFRGIPKHFVPSVLPERTVRQLTSTKTANNLLPEGFTFFPSFFDVREQRLLLTTALSQLDATEGIRVRRLQSDFRARNPVSDSTPVEGVFLPDRYYTFHEVSTNSKISLFSTVRSSRVTTTMSFGIIAKCASLPGRNLTFVA